MVFRSYLELVRPANVVTAMADIVAGYAVSGAANPTGLAWLLVATVCLYAGGIVLNDFFDRGLDAIERPERPIPSGRVSARGAATFGGLLLAIGAGAAFAASIAAAAIALGIVCSVLLYDSWGKHRMFIGPFNMGLCRALNLVLGIAALPSAVRLHWALGLLPLIYIAGVTALSRGEVRGGKKSVALGSLLAIGGVSVALAWIAHASSAALVTVAVFALRVLPPFLRAYGRPESAVIRNAIRTGVLSLVLLDAAIAAAYSGLLFSLIIYMLGVLAWLAARSFAVT